jgi:membrane-bound ClpP family serine protease
MLHVGTMKRIALIVGVLSLGMLVVLSSAAPRAFEVLSSTAKQWSTVYLRLVLGGPELGLHTAAAWIGSHAVPVGAGVIAAMCVVGIAWSNRSVRSRPITGAEGMIGEVGHVVAPLRPAGMVFVHGEYWDAIACASIRTGARIRVLRVVGMRLHVENADATCAVG